MQKHEASLCHTYDSLYSQSIIYSELLASSNRKEKHTITLILFQLCEQEIYYNLNLQKITLQYVWGYKQKTPQMWGLIDFLFNYETKLSQLYFLFELRLCTKFSFSVHQQSFVNLLFYYQKLQLQYYWQSLLHNL